MNQQEIFDTVVKHLRQQGRQSLRPGINSSDCAYRGTDGLMCAVGCLLKDEEYEPSMDTGLGVNAKELFQQYPHIAKRLGNNNAFLLRSLQRVHDSCEVYKWEEQLEIVAKDYKLTYTPKEVGVKL